MYSSQTREARLGAISVANTGTWVNTGEDWDGNPGILLGDQGCWKPLRFNEAVLLIEALKAKLKEFGYE